MEWQLKLIIDRETEHNGNWAHLMKLSLSARIAEEFLSKEEPSMSLEVLADLAVAAGYNALCMRASQQGIHSPVEHLKNAMTVLESRGLSVSMVTGDFDIVYNNDQGPACLQNIRPYLHLARALKAPLIRVALKKEENIPMAQSAADEAEDFGVRLVHQCHTLSLFETVDGIEDTLRRIDRSNFGLIYEPANLELCGQDYGPETIKRLAPWIRNVYLQNQALKADGQVTLNTWHRGPVPFDITPIHSAGGINFESVFEGLATINYRGPITAHQSAVPGQAPGDTAKATADYLASLAVQKGLD